MERMDAAPMSLSQARAVAATALPEAFERLFRDEYARVTRVAYRVTGDRGEAEDVAQEVFLAFYRRHPAEAPYAAAWLHKAAAHVALNAVRSRTRRDARERAEAASREAPDPERDAIERERAREVRAVLTRLPRPAAAILALRYSGLSYIEVAAALEIKADQVGTRLRRAHEAFRREVARGHA